MDWGLKNRMARMIDPDSGRILMLAVDHGYFQGPTTGLARFAEAVGPLLPHADTLMVTRGMLRAAVDPALRIPVMLRVSGGNSILGELSNENLTCDIEDALRLNVAGITTSIYVGAPGEHQSLLALGKLVDWGNRYGVPVMAVTAVGRDMVRDLRYLGLACRIAAEIGCHMVKTYHCEGFPDLVASIPVPVVIAGGKKIPEPEALQLAEDAVRDGAVGVDMGRNIFQSDAPAAMIQAVRSIVHRGASAKEALERFRRTKAAPGGR